MAKYQKDLFALFYNIFSCYKKERIYLIGDNYSRSSHKPWRNWKCLLRWNDDQVKFSPPAHRFLLQVDFISWIKNVSTFSTKSTESYAQRSFPYKAACWLVSCALKVGKWYFHLHRAANFSKLTTTSGAVWKAKRSAEHCCLFRWIPCKIKTDFFQNLALYHFLCWSGQIIFEKTRTSPEQRITSTWKAVKNHYPSSF